MKVTGKEDPGPFECALEGCITACNAYVKGCGEGIVLSIQESIKRLSDVITADVHSQHLFTEEDRLTSDCLISLLSVLSEADSTLTSSILSFIHLICSEPCTATLLMGMGAIDTIVGLLDEHHTTNPFEVTHTLARITRHVTFTGHEPFIDNLLQQLIHNVVSYDASLKPALFVLVNLSRACLPIQMQLLSLDRSSMLRKTLSRLVCHDDNEISIGSLAAMISTGLAEEFNKFVTKDKNLDQVLKLSFSMIHTLSTVDAFGYAVDVMVYMLRNKRVQQFLVNSCPRLESFISKTVSLLTRCEEPKLAKLFELLLEFSAIPTIRMMLATLVFAPIASSGGDEQELLQHIFYLAKRSVSVDSGASVLALKFITYIYETLSLDPSRAGSTCHLNFQFLSECLKQNELDSKRHSAKVASADKLLAALTLLEVLVTSEVFTSGVLSEIEPATLTDVIEYQLQTNPLAFSWNCKQSEQKTQQPSEWRIGAQVVLKDMSVLIEITERNDSFATCLSDYLQKTSLLPFLAIGLSSSSTENVQLALKIVTKSASLGHLQTTVLSDVLSGLNNKRAKPVSLSTRTSQQSLRPMDTERKEAVVLFNSPCHSPSGDKVVLSSQDSQVDITDKLSSLLIGGDSHVSDIVSVYEQKLRAQKTHESHMDDLVQAKTMALSQADRLIQQYKSRLAQVDSEMHKLRNIVHESERRSEGYRDKMNEMLMDRERMQTELERLLQDSRKLEETQKSLSLVKRELETLTYFNENLKHQHQNLEAEFSQIREADRKKAAAIIEKDAKIAELKKNVKKGEEQLKKLTSEKNSQEETLTAQIKKLEKTILQQEDKLRVIFEAVKR